jgi:uncharacterized protein (DUF1697 family)
MKDLCSALAKDGFAEVRSFIQSGNLIFSASAGRDQQELSTTISALIAKQFGLTIPIIIRSVTELSQVVKANPYKNADSDLQYIMFLQEAPAAELAACLDPQRSPPDEFSLLGKEVFLLLKNTAARTKLTNSYFDSKLKTISTSRNIRTTTTLLEMMQN